MKNYINNDKVIDRLRDVSGYLLSENFLPEYYQDHPLKGKFLGYKECHLLPNLLLVYEIDKKEQYITFAFLGSHSDIFG